MDSDHLIGLVNLSQVQIDRGCIEDAVATMDAAMYAANKDTPIYGIIQEARQEIELRSPSTACL